MFTNIEDVRECIIYPGAYTAAHEKDELFENSKLPKNTTFNKAVATIKELDDIYQLSIEIDATLREEITLQVDDIILFVSVIHRNSNEKQKTEIKDNPIETNYIILPKNADTEFMSAEFNNGKLTLHIPKSEKEITSHIKEVIVY
jgi:HSP20 family molecular chaperone IbpA